MIKRIILEQVEKCFFKQRAIIIYGARQVGKTTLIRQLQEKYTDSVYLNCDEPDVRNALTDKSSTELHGLAGKHKVVFIDEAQRVKNIGLTLKLFVDNFPKLQIVATGSSSLDLSNVIKEPLTGRKFEFHLYPFSLMELGGECSEIELKRLLERRMLYGMYPAAINAPENAEMILKELSSSYLYKDVLQYQNIKRPEILEKLLLHLAFQIGSEVSYNELAGKLGVNKQTVANYIDLLEKSFVIFSLGPFSRNLRNELTKMRKIYFYDTGIRNSLIQNYNSVEFRSDTGVLWENFIIAERMKYNSLCQRYVNAYFWRTYQQQEIDYLEDSQGKLGGFEFKWKSGKNVRAPKAFAESYPGATVETITPGNFLRWLT
ncbi:MAG: ATPase [Lentisphaerae bacterium GWF2_45_14]|nr:MAG: ATPase [Lentisphaerae bacterium GWF2_45_14]